MIFTLFYWFIYTLFL